MMKELSEDLTIDFNGRIYVGFTRNSKPMEHTDAIAAAIVYSEGDVDSVWYVYDSITFRHSFEFFLREVMQVANPAISYYSRR